MFSSFLYRFLSFCIIILLYFVSNCSKSLQLLHTTVFQRGICYEKQQHKSVTTQRATATKKALKNSGKHPWNPWLAF